MKINQAHIGLQVVLNDLPNATVYEITELRRDGNRVDAVLQELDHPKRAEFVSEVCYLQIPTIEQLTA